MVRLVFRPYTQVRRSICTLESLRTSTRVSPGFALLRHSSPSFGSQHLCSNSNLSPEDHGRSMLPHCCFTPFTFITHYGFATQILAHMLDSLVRVSRRVNYGHFVSFLSLHHQLPASGAVIRDTTCCLMDERTTRSGAGSIKRRKYPRPLSRRSKQDRQAAP